jgi:hypothetical protein
MLYGTAQHVFRTNGSCHSLNSLHKDIDKKNWGLSVPDPIQVIANPNSIVLIEEGNSLESVGAKLKLVKISLEAGIALNPFNRLSLIYNIVRMVLEESDWAVRARGYQILLDMEKKEEALASINFEIGRFLTGKISSERVLQFIRRPINNLTITLPLKPHIVKVPSLYLHLVSAPDRVLIQERKVHDAFWQIEEILTGSDVGCFLPDLQEIAKREGFCVTDLEKVLHFPDIDWLRDAMVILDDGNLLIPSRIHLEASGDIGDYFEYEEIAGLLCGDKERLTTIGMFGYYNKSQMLLDAPLDNVVEATFYFEGGNILSAVNRFGKKVTLFGANNILFSILNANYLFKTAFKIGQLLQKVDGDVPQERIEFVQKRLEEAGMLWRLSNEKEKGIAARVALAMIKIFENEMECFFGKDYLIIGDPFNRPVEFHLDMFLMPAPEGVIFIQDFALTKEVIDVVKGRYRLSEEENERLEIYADRAIHLDQLNREQLKQISNLLTNAGFHVVAVPGAYYGRDNQRCINFLNAIVGKGKGEYFCMTNGSKHPVDRYLRDAFASILNFYGIPHVYFAGRKRTKEVWEPFIPHSYPYAGYSLEENCGGIHCATQVINGLNKGKVDLREGKAFIMDDEQDGFVGETLPRFFKNIMTHFSPV